MNWLERESAPRTSPKVSSDGVHRGVRRWTDRATQSRGGTTAKWQRGPTAELDVRSSSAPLEEKRFETVS